MMLKKIRFYREGYEQGVVDGSSAGRVEGRVFGLERGFEKYLGIGCLYGQSLILASRLSQEDVKKSGGGRELEDGEQSDHARRLPVLPNNSRMEKHIRVLDALAEPDSISTENNEEAVSDLEDRFKRAQAKIKIIEKATGEPSVELGHGIEKELAQTGRAGEVANIEDPSILHARH